MHVLTEVDPELIARLREEDDFFWIDLVGPDRRRRSTPLGAALDLHPVALEDTLEFGQRPKIEPYVGPRPDRLLHGATATAAGRAARGARLHLGRVHRDACTATVRRRSTSLHASLAEEPTHDEEC